jgi:DNA repair protein RAD16
MFIFLYLSARASLHLGLQVCHSDLVLKTKTNPHFSADVVEATVSRALQRHSRGRNRVQVPPHLRPRTHKTILQSGLWNCPVCHIPLSVNLEAEALELAEDTANKARQGILGRIELDIWKSSSKIEALVEELSNLRRQDCTTKSIVFSQL